MPVSVNRVNRFMLVLTPIGLILSGLSSLNKALASTPYNCPSIVGSLTCSSRSGTDCVYTDRQKYGTECGGSTQDGCCQYDAYNVHCTSPSGALCPTGFYGNNMTTHQGKTCTGDDFGGVCR